MSTRVDSLSTRVMPVDRPFWLLSTRVVYSMSPGAQQTRWLRLLSSRTLWLMTTRVVLRA